MKSLLSWLRREYTDTKILMRSIPATVVTLFVVSVICMNLLANKTLLQLPWIALDGDDRTGASAAGENLRINGAKIPEIKRVLVYTFISDGAANWQTANGVVTLRYPGNEDIIVRMDEYNNARRMCAIALLENDGGDGFIVEKQVSFFDGHAQMDKAYGWGMRWVPGRK